MNQLANFNNEPISCILAQNEYKLLIIALGTLSELTDATKHKELRPTIDDEIKNAFKQSGFKLDNRLIDNTAIVVDMLRDKLMDSYMDTRSEYIERANSELHQYATENFHPDIFNLPEGETLKVAEL